MVEELKLKKRIDDLGLSAFLKLYGWKIISRNGKTFTFEIKSSEENEFNKTIYDYGESQCHLFDAEIMNLKRLPMNYSNEQHF